MPVPSVEPRRAAGQEMQCQGLNKVHLLRADIDYYGCNVCRVCVLVAMHVLGLRKIGWDCSIQTTMANNLQTADSFFS